jgi:hypothetical protein
LASSVTKLPTVALATVISVLSNPATSSLKVAVTLNAALTVVADGDVKATVGAVKSAVRTSCVAAVLLLLAISVAVAAGTSTVTGPSALGVTVKL